MNDARWFQCPDCKKLVRLKSVFGLLHVCSSLRTEIEIARSRSEIAKREYERYANKRLRRRKARRLKAEYDAAQAIAAQMNSIRLPPQQPMREVWPLTRNPT